MIIEQTFTVSGSREQVAEFLSAPDQMLYCVPGVEEVTLAEDGFYKATLKAKVGPIRASFSGSVTIDSSEAPERIKASGEGRDRATGTVAKVTLSAELVETEPNVTTIISHSDVALRGRLGQFGTGVIQSIASEMIGQFASCVESRVNGDESQGAPDAVSSPNLASVAMRGVAKGAASRLRGGRKKEEEQ
jgi:uncharacterized protein